MKPALALSAALIATSLSIREASAYSVFVTCFGDDVIWDEHPYVPRHNTFSIPIGSVREEALVNAINQWNGVRGMSDVIQARTFNSGSTIVSFSLGSARTVSGTVRTPDGTAEFSGKYVLMC